VSGKKKIAAPTKTIYYAWSSLL